MQDTACLGLVHGDDPERYVMRREVGGGFRIENSCTLVADHVDVWQNQYSVVK